MVLNQVEQMPMLEAGRPWASVAAPRPVKVVAPAPMALDQVEQMPMPEAAGCPWASAVAPEPVKVEDEVQLQMLEP